MKHELQFRSGGVMVLRIDETGRIHLNPEIPQEEAVVAFLKLCEVHLTTKVEYAMPDDLHEHTPACERRGCVAVRRVTP